MCRLQKPGLRFSGSASEKTDSRQGELGIRVVPTADTHYVKVSDNPRPRTDSQ